MSFLRRLGRPILSSYTFRRVPHKICRYKVRSCHSLTLHLESQSTSIVIPETPEETPHNTCLKSRLVATDPLDASRIDVEQSDSSQVRGTEPNSEELEPSPYTHPAGSDGTDEAPEDPHSKARHYAPQATVDIPRTTSEHTPPAPLPPPPQEVVRDGEVPEPNRQIPPWYWKERADDGPSEGVYPRTVVSCGYSSGTVLVD
jgi:hypothetical protein